MTLFAGRAGGRMAARWRPKWSGETTLDRGGSSRPADRRCRGRESARRRRPPRRQPEAGGGLQASEPVAQAAVEIDRRGLGEVLRRAAHLADAIAAPAGSPRASDCRRRNRRSCPRAGAPGGPRGRTRDSRCDTRRASRRAGCSRRASARGWPRTCRTGIPPERARPPRMREPSMQSCTSQTIGATSAGRSFGVYW